MPSTRRRGAALLVAAALLAACSDDADDGGAGDPAAAERDERDVLDVPPEVAEGAAGWPVLVWDTEVPGDPLGGALVVGDLVFTATLQGEILALDRGTGEVVRTLRAPGGVNGWPAATDDTIVWPIGQAEPPALVAYRVRG